MKIKNVSCTQFAGARYKDISFDDGINIVYGKNESGKSTLVNLISRTMFQNSVIDGRRDKEFKNLYFPGVKKNNVKGGDCIDGTVSFETENGRYTLSKEWGYGNNVKLSTPDAVIRDQNSINDILKKELVYGEGVYSDMLFSSQNNTNISLETILDAKQKTDAKKEIADVVSQAFVETGSISIDKIEEGINAKINTIAGKHWDFDSNMPGKRNSPVRWTKDIGSIHAAYYELDDAKMVLNEINELERQVDQATSSYNEMDAKTQRAENNYKKFIKYENLLGSQKDKEEILRTLKQELEDCKIAQDTWPIYEERLNRAKKLEKESNDRGIIDKYDQAKQLHDELNRKTNDVNVPCPSSMEISNIKDKQKKIANLKNKLCQINLNADIRMFGGNDIEVRSLISGEMLNITDNKISIEEAVKITIPEVMEMQLYPADVNAAEIENEINEATTYVNMMLQKYKAENIEELEELEKRISDLERDIRSCKDRLDMLLEGVSFEELEKIFESIPLEVRSKEDIDIEIREICGNDNIAHYITEKETRVNEYINRYDSIAKLKQKIDELETRKEKQEQQLIDLTDIPEEYKAITDTDAYHENLERILKLNRAEKETKLSKKIESTQKLESYRENCIGDPYDKVKESERIFEEQKTLLKHWIHIKEVFEGLKENMHDNPIQGLADNFAKYLNVISDERVYSEFPETDKLNINIYSDDVLLDYQKLSEGTKETVSLAFRLAVLDHLFPDGGGVIIFDDPCTDMDEERAALSCELIQKCAERHQVLFFTCREEYLDMLKGNVIKL